MIGQTISHYKILEKLGEGGMGVVYKAEDTKLKRMVALKFLPKELTNVGANGDSPVERFHREAQAAAALNHPNIVTIHEINEFDDQTYIAMEYIEGSTLKELITSGPLPFEKIIDITNQICEGLDLAHEQDIVHRDIKPQNILIDKNGKVKILDFGLAKLKGAQQLTRESSTLGTVHYMSPEQAKGEEVDKRSDIWSLGVILYEMITGRLPFEAEYEQAVTYAIINVTPKPIDSIRPGISKKVSKLVEMLLSKSPDQRFSRCSEIQRFLNIVFDKDPDTLLMKPVSKDPGSGLSKKWGIGLVLAAIVIILALAIGKLFFKPTVDTPVLQKISIAVLPFVNVSPDKGNEYFCDGITEDIITQLSKINDLKVTSRTSVFYFKNKDAKLSDVARELGVTNILEGSVRQSDNRVRITAQLINAETDAHLWAETYDRELKEIFNIQSDVAGHIAKTLKITLFPELSKRISKRPTDNMEAYQLYLQGKYHWNKRTPAELLKAISFFEKAVAIDPEYALGYSGLAETYVVIGDLHNAWRKLHDVKFESAYSKAEKYCLKALSLDSELAQAHAALGEIKCDWKWDFKGAEAALKKAIKLNPNYATAHQWLAEYYNVMGKVTLAQKSIARARELDPFSIIMQFVEARIYMASREYEKTIEILKQILEKTPDFEPARFAISMAYMFNKSYDMALQYANKNTTQIRRDFLRGRIQIRQGEVMKVEKLFEEKLSNPATYEYPAALAIAYAEVGKMDEALKWVKKAIEKRSFIITTRHDMGRCDALYKDPRVKKMLLDAGLK